MSAIVRENSRRRWSYLMITQVALSVLLGTYLQQTASAAEVDEAALLIQFKQANAGNPAVASWTTSSLPCSNGNFNQLEFRCSCKACQHCNPASDQQQQQLISVVLH